MNRVSNAAKARVGHRRSRTASLARAAIETLESRRLLANSAWVFPGGDGKLLYQPRPLGDHIEDFSNAGYKGGMTAIPGVPVANLPQAIVSPIAGDDTANIQAAINAVSALPLDASGFRGAALLQPGTYEVGTSLSVTASGVILRGSGQAQTLIHATGVGERTIINVDGNGTRSVVSNTTHTITDKYVPVGAISFTVDSTANLHVGDTVVVHRPSTQNWINDLGMNLLDNPWTPGSKDIDLDRTITHIDGNVITIDASITQALDLQYTDASNKNTIYAYTATSRLTNVGVEGIGGYSDYNPAIISGTDFTDEDHPWIFINLDGVQNGWVRNVTSQYFGYACVSVTGNSKWVTVQDSQCLDPVSQITGGRRYSFNIDDSSNCLFRNLYAREGRHDFVEGSGVDGPNVFVDDRADNTHADAGPHHRYSTAALWDNITAGDLNIQNRGNLGSGHGWAGANQVIWNSKADFVVQNPPTAQNWLIGGIGTIGNGTVYVGPHDPGIYDSTGPSGPNVTPRSLYYAQLGERSAYENFTLREVRLGDSDNYTNDGAADNVAVDPAWKTSVQSATGQTAVGFDSIANTQLVPFTFNFAIDPGTYVVGASLGLGLKSAGNNTSGDRIYIENTAGKVYSWSDLGISAPGTSAVGAVIDLSRFLAALQDGKLNLAVSGNTAIDWATLNLQTASTTQPATTTLPASADAYVQDGASAGSNFGSATSLQTKLDATNNDRESYLKFDVSSLSGAVVKATVRLVPTSVGYGNASSFGSGIGAMFNQISFVSDDSWTEGGLNWNNRPVSGAAFDEFVSSANAPLNFDVTSLVQSALAGDKNLSLRLQSITQSSSGQINFGSRENADANFRPQLIIQTFNALNPVADAYVRSGASASVNFGLASDLANKQDTSSTTDNNREAFLKFDLTGIATAPAGATIRLMPLSVGANVAAAAGFVSTDSWTEAGITWNTKPGSSTSLGTSLPSQATPVKFDATAQVTSTIAGDKLLSARVFSNAVSSGVNEYASREFGDMPLRPMLVLKNLGPQITALSNLNGSVNAATTAMWFGVWDAETAASSLAVSASSSNTSLLPNANVTFGGSGTDRTFTLTPISGATGTTMVTITVTDPQGQTASTTFQYSVTSATQINGDQDAPGENDAIRIVRNGAFLDVFRNNPVMPILHLDYASASQLVVNALAGDDTTTVDFSGGNPIPAGGLSIDSGASGGDSVSVVGTGGSDAFAFAAGTMTVNGVSFDYTNTEEVDLQSGGGTDTIAASGNASLAATTMSVTLSGGTTSMTAGSTLPDFADLNVAGSAAFNLNGQSQTIDSLSGAGMVLNNGATAATLTIGQSGGGGVFSGSLTNGSGGLTLIKNGAGTETLSGANSYTGATKIQGGTLKLGSASSLPNTALTLGGGSDAGILDLNNFSATLPTLLATGNNATGNAIVNLSTSHTLTISGGTGGNALLVGGLAIDNAITKLAISGGGTLAVTNSAASILVDNDAISSSSTHVCTLDLSGLAAFIADVDTLNLGVSPINGARARGVLNLAASNTITANSITMGRTTANAAGGTALDLGHANTIHVNAITLATGKGNSASIQFRAGLSSPSVSLTDKNTGLGTDLTVGYKSNAGTADPAGTVDFTSGVVNATLHNLVLGWNAFTQNTATGVFSMAGGSVTAASVTLGRADAAGGAGNGMLNLSGGTFAVLGAIALGAPVAGATSSGTINLNGGIATFGADITDNGGASALNLAGGSLDLDGHAIGSATNPIDTLTFASGTLSNVAEINGGGALNKTTVGTLILTGANTYTGATNVFGGTLLLQSSLATTSAVNVSGALLQIAQGQSRLIKTPSVTTGAGGRLDLTDNKLIVTTANSTGSWNGVAYTSITALIAAGRNQGGWGGSGIVTSMPSAVAGNLTTLAVANAGKALNLADEATAIWAGETIHGSDTIVMYTYGGDANLDGKINVDDYTIIDFNVGIQGAPFQATAASGGLAAASSRAAIFSVGNLIPPASADRLEWPTTRRPRLLEELDAEPVSRA